MTIVILSNDDAYNNSNCNNSTNVDDNFTASKDNSSINTLTSKQTTAHAMLRYSPLPAAILL